MGVLQVIPTKSQVPGLLFGILIWTMFLSFQKSWAFYSGISEQCWVWSCLSLSGTVLVYTRDNALFSFFEGSSFGWLEKEMATHSSVLAWRIPGTGEPGGPPSLGSHRVRLDWSDLATSNNNIWMINQVVLRSVCKVDPALFQSLLGVRSLRCDPCPQGDGTVVGKGRQVLFEQNL